jgi:polysaccharide biosynthesis transport protein
VPRKEAIHSTDVPGLDVLPRGNFDERAAELLGSPAVKDLFAALREQYDLVIIDTPPVLVASDASAVAAMADGAIVVVRVGSTPRDAARLTLEQLQGVGAHVIGFVLNDPDHVGARYGDYAYRDAYYAVEA